MGGEKGCGNCPALRTIGSPPHGRGKVADDMNDMENRMDHPRMGGEKG